MLSKLEMEKFETAREAVAQSQIRCPWEMHKCGQKLMQQFISPVIKLKDRIITKSFYSLGLRREWQR